MERNKNLLEAKNNQQFFLVKKKPNKKIKAESMHKTFQLKNLTDKQSVS